ncbi:hypothetical protein Daura_15830 [Dactylosporangium aurantiacum]|uniref:Uncharacterized protein n=1 Tax=Dactylosporangium aurantiacum TaxID=35754 RepID=A0A9Q9MFR8_9ACTN|nr:hypothetical protein [Dactylosporangium aurantiacum]UWZ57488.1 hypothetical protein Daura_15830 [Dactylosporangium aurantiacum]
MRIPPPAARAAVAPVRPDERRDAIEELRGHPALRSGDGQDLVRTLDRWTSSLRNADAAAAAIPPHCAYIVAAIARACAEEYLELANELAAATDRPRPPTPHRRPTDGPRPGR